MISRALFGAALALAIALVANRAGALSAGGAAAAAVVGTIAVTAGWDWGALLIAYFAASTALSRLGRAEKEHRTAAIIAKGGARDAAQVAANGLVFALSAVAFIAWRDGRWFALGAGSLAASAADSWATELGTLYGGVPRSLASWRAVPTGTSGGISAIGSLAACAGAGFVVLVASLLGARAMAGALAAGGLAGVLVDSLLGATVQRRRWCPACERQTERTTHDCGTPTAPRGGLAWLDNDMVNLLSNAAGGLVALALAR
ncbi:MAG: DUF92 domain-containing protein [Gemmatimonadales bacterium]|jgi:uncharacterized protein (TIGR00297 family)